MDRSTKIQLSKILDSMNKEISDLKAELEQLRKGPEPKEEVKETTNKSLRVGSKIRHKVFGDGIVVNFDGTKITVAFAKEYGIKTLLADHPSITRI